MWARAAIGPRADWIVALGLAVGYQLEIWASPLFDGRTILERAAAAVVALVVTLPLGLRRYRPASVLVVVVAAATVGFLLDDPTEQGSLAGFLAMMLAFYSVGAWGDARRGLIVGATTLAASGAFFLVLGAFVREGGADPGAGIAFGLAWLVGRELRRRRDEAEMLRERATRLEEERDERGRATALEERARIARELHDVVAHSVSVMVVQAQAAQRVLEGEQRTAREALGAIESSGRQALVELRRLLGSLRDSTADEALAPQPSMQHLEALAQQMREAGLPVQIQIDGTPQPLAPGVDLSAYRIVQEGLTNVLRHAGPARAEVNVRYGPGELELDIIDDGAGNGKGRGAGQGLVGVRERVAFYGGRLEAGRRPEGGHRLRAWLPLGGD